MVWPRRKGASCRFGLPGASVDYEIGPPIRDAMAEVLRQRGGVLDASDRALFDPARPRFALPGEVPIQCGQQQPAP